MTDCVDRTIPLVVLAVLFVKYLLSRRRVPTGHISLAHSPKIPMPSYRIDPAQESPAGRVVYLDDIYSVSSDVIPSTEGAVIAHKSPAERYEVRSFLRGYRSECGKVRLEASMSRFYLDDDDSFSIAGDDIRLKVTLPPIGCENNESLVFKKTGHFSLSPSSRGEVAYEPTAN